MELRSCMHLHFIQAIKGGLVIKASNMNSCGRPAHVFKKLKDVYEAGDAKYLSKTSTVQSKDGYADVVFGYSTVKNKSPCLPLAERKTKKRVTETNNFTCYASNSETDSEVDDVSLEKMTLKQLKKRCKIKKRKVSNSTGSTPTPGYSNVKLEDDDFDLMDSLSSWKSKLSKKKVVKKKCGKKHVSTSPEMAVSVKSEQFPGAVESLQYHGDSTYIDVKVEVPEPADSECLTMSSVADDSSIHFNEEIGFCQAITNEIVETINCDLRTGESISLKDDCQTCSLNEISYDYGEEVVPISSLLPICMEATGVVDMERTTRLAADLPVSEFLKGHVKHRSSPETSPTKDYDSIVCNSSQSDFNTDETICNCGDQVPDLTIDDSCQPEKPTCGANSCLSEDDIKQHLHSYLDTGFLGSPAGNCSSYWNSSPLVTCNDDSASTQDGLPSKVSDSSNSDEASDFPFPNNVTVSLEDDSATIMVKELLISTADTGRNCSTGSPPLNELSPSTIKNHHLLGLRCPPERLLSTRKVISPSSQERLCRAMKSVELNDKRENYKCKGKLFFGKQTGERSNSPVRSDFHNAEAAIHHGGPKQVNRIKHSLSPKQIIKKLKNDKRNSPPKGIVKDPRLSHSLPQGNTGCTSVRNCSESAIAFSQRQMHDIECLALKLLKELKTMKDIVEENLQSEVDPYPAASLQYQEVKTAIKNATKLEETSRKWLSMMARDCNRFCKIMRLTDKGDSAEKGNASEKDDESDKGNASSKNGDAASGNAIPKEKRKITFADEAGGTLCQVKFFEDGIASPDGPSQEQELKFNNSEAIASCTLYT